eukprot:600967-Hanusia_phi.AAC.3
MEGSQEPLLKVKEGVRTVIPRREGEGERGPPAAGGRRAQIQRDPRQKVGRKARGPQDERSREQGQRELYGASDSGRQGSRAIGLGKSPRRGPARLLPIAGEATGGGCSRRRRRTGPARTEDGTVSEVRAGREIDPWLQRKRPRLAAAKSATPP